MTGNKIEELLMELLAKVSSIDALLTTSQSILKDHEHRIDVLERHPSNQANTIMATGQNDNNDFKTQLLLLLGKALLIALITLGTLAGAGGIISNMFSTTINQQMEQTRSL